jgi:beta-phosphoglucomutase
MIRAILFDLDGLLIDSEPVHFKCWRQALAAVGVDLEWEVYLDHWFRAGLGINDFCKQRGLKHDPDVIREHKAKLYEKLLITDLELMPGARLCLESHWKQRPLALATGGYIEAVNPALDKHDLRKFFDAMVTRQDVKHVKPHPEVFLRTAELLKIPPAECVVLEDAEIGIRAAHAAGMYSVAIPTPTSRDADFSLADGIWPSLHQATPAAIDALAE